MPMCSLGHCCYIIVHYVSKSILINTFKHTSGEIQYYYDLVSGSFVG